VSSETPRRSSPLPTPIQASPPGVCWRCLGFAAESAGLVCVRQSQECGAPFMVMPLAIAAGEGVAEPVVAHPPWYLSVEGRWRSGLAVDRTRSQAGRAQPP
jgi:hypothetical protein